MKRLIIIMLSMLLLAGCVTSENIDQSPISNSVIKDGFELTITSAKREYSLRHLFYGNPLDIVATFTYIGEQESVEIWHASEIGVISLYHESGSFIIGPDMNLEQFHTTLVKGESITLTRDFAHWFYRGKYVKGIYTAVVDVNIAFDKNNLEEINISTDILFTINK